MFISCSNGNPNAAVFPVPVCAKAIRSVLLSRRRGITLTCTSVGVSKPSFSIECRSLELRPKDLNVAMNYFMVANVVFFNSNGCFLLFIIKKILLSKTGFF